MLIDDLDGGEAHQTITLEIDGKRFEVDLSNKNANDLRAKLAPYAQAGLRIGKTVGTPKKTTNGSNGYRVPSAVFVPPPAAQEPVGPVAAPAPVQPKKTVPAAPESAPAGPEIVDELPPAKVIRAWLREHRPDIEVADRGRLRPELEDIFRKGQVKKTTRRVARAGR